VESAESIGEGFALGLETLGSLKSFPEHGTFLSLTGRQPGLQAYVLWSPASRCRPDKLRAGDGRRLVQSTVDGRQSTARASASWP
jgi:hypothetical protein